MDHHGTGMDRWTGQGGAISGEVPSEGSWPTHLEVGDDPPRAGHAVRGPHPPTAKPTPLLAPLDRNRGLESRHDAARLQHPTDRAYRCALELANLIGPHAARHHGALIAIIPGQDHLTVTAIDRVSAAPVCWACGDELNDEVVRTSWLSSRPLASADAPLVMIRSCLKCGALTAPEGATS